MNESKLGPSLIEGADLSPHPGSSFSGGLGPGMSMSGPPEGRDFRKLRRELVRVLVWAGSLLFVFIIAAWVSLPTRSIAWRISHEARQKGINLSIEDISIRPWGSASLHGVTWSFSPSRPDSTPVPFVIEELDVSFSVLKYLLFDEIDVEFEGTLDEGQLSGAYALSEEESKVVFTIEDLPLYGVPKLQDAVNAPVRGIFALSVDLTMPEGKWAKASGRMEIHCYSCSIGDGETKLYVPGSKKGGMMSKGVTIPEINLGTLDGVLLVEDGKAVAEEFGNESDDLQIKISGDIDFKDPFKSSRLNLLVKVFITDQLRQRADQLDLMVATASDKVKMDPPDEGWLGYRLEGNIKSPRFRGIKQKTRQQALMDKREARKKRLEERAKQKADRDKAKAAAKAEAEAAAAGAEAEGGEGGETGGEEQSAEGGEPTSNEVQIIDREIPPEVGVIMEEPVAEEPAEGGEAGAGGDEVGPGDEGGGEQAVEEQPAEEQPVEEGGEQQLPQ